MRPPETSIPLIDRCGEGIERLGFAPMHRPSDDLSPPDNLVPPPDNGGVFWVFGYGSLMWRPDFPHLEARKAACHGFHRALCISSIRYRGTSERPGLVLGLDRGGKCQGRAFRVADDAVPAVVAYLYDREMLTGVYRPRWLAVCLDDGRRIQAFGFVARRDHEQYRGSLSPDDAARLVRQGHGSMGPNVDYVRNTLEHLRSIGIEDRALARILTLVESGDH